MVKLEKIRKTARILMVLPTLGQRPDYLKQTLESIKNQSPILYDIVMIYPLDNKQTAELARQYGAKSLADPGTLSGAVNVGVASANDNHEFIGWIGDDDLISAESLEIAIKTLDDSPSASAAFGYCDYINEQGNKIMTSRAGWIAPWLMTWGPNLVPCPGAVFRLSALREAGEFAVENKYSMDLDMFLRLRKIGKLVNTKRVQASFRWHATSTTVANRSKVVKETEKVKRKHLPAWAKPFAFIWEMPVRLATRLAANRLNKMSQ